MDHSRYGAALARPGDTGGAVGTVCLDVAEIEDYIVFLFKVRYLAAGNFVGNLFVFCIVFRNMKALFLKLFDKQLCVTAAGIMVARLVADGNDINIFLLFRI